MGLPTSIATSPPPAVVADISDASAAVVRAGGEALSTLPQAYRQVKSGTAPEHGKLLDEHSGVVSRKRRLEIVTPAQTPEAIPLDGPVKKIKPCSEHQDSPKAEHLNNRMPSSYRTLVCIYESLLMGQALLLARHDRCTFDSLKQAAENSCGRQIKLSHLQQIKSVYPEAVEWSWVRSDKTPTGCATRGRFTLKLSLGPATEALSSTLPKSVMMKRHRPAMQSTAMQASVDTLNARLMERAEAQACSESDGDSPRSDGLNFIHLAPLPVHPDDEVRRNTSCGHGVKKATTSILSLDSSVSEVTCSDGDRGQVRRASHNRRVTFGPTSVRKIPSRSCMASMKSLDDSSSTDTEDEEEDTECDSCPGLTVHHSDLPQDGFGLETLAYVSNCVDLLDDSTSPKLDISSLPEVLRTPNSDGELPLSMETLEMLGEWERQDKARDEEAELQKAARARAEAALPRTFDLLQALFGSSGPCAMTLDKVIDCMETSCKARNPTSTAEVQEMLYALAAAAPNYLKLLKSSETSSRRAMVRINRKQDWVRLRKELTARASRAQQ